MAETTKRRGRPRLGDWSNPREVCPKCGAHLLTVALHPDEGPRRLWCSRIPCGYDTAAVPYAAEIAPEQAPAPSYAEEIAASPPEQAETPTCDGCNVEFAGADPGDVHVGCGTIVSHAEWARRKRKAECCGPFGACDVCGPDEAPATPSPETTVREEWVVQYLETNGEWVDDSMALVQDSEADGLRELRSMREGYEDTEFRLTHQVVAVRVVSERIVTGEET